MKPATLIVMSVGLVIAIIGCSLCFIATNTAEKEYPDDGLFIFEGENYQVIDGDTIRTEDFSDVIYVQTEDEVKAVEQDVKVLSVALKNVEHVEIIGGQGTSKVMVYNMQAGLYACRIGSGVMKMTNRFEKSLIFDYLSDAIGNFKGIRKYFNPESLKNKEKKVVVHINDADLLNRIELDFTNCKNVTVKNLTCSLDCKVVLDNSDILFENCVFKEPEIIWDNDSSVSGTESSETSPSPDVSPDLPSGPVADDPTEEPSSSTEEDEEKGPTYITHYLTVNLNMKNGSSFTANGCSFSSMTAVVNKTAISADDITSSTGDETVNEELIGTYVSNGGAKCTLNLDLTMAGVLYGFDVRNVPDEDKAEDLTLVTVYNGYAQQQIFLENAGNEDYPQIKINASNCEIHIKN